MCMFWKLCIFQNYKPFVCSLCQYKTGLRGNLDKHIRTVHQLDVVTKHTVHLKMKFKGRQSGDILTKDGQLINMIEDHRGEDPRRLQVVTWIILNNLTSLSRIIFKRKELICALENISQNCQQTMLNYVPLPGVMGHIVFGQVPLSVSISIGVDVGVGICRTLSCY